MTVKVVLKLGLHDDKYKKKSLSKVSGLPGVESYSVDIKDNTLTVIGDVDPVLIVSKHRKVCHADIITVGPAKEPEKKKEEPKKVEPKKQEQKKKEPEPAPTPAKAPAKEPEPAKVDVADNPYPAVYNPYPTQYFVRSVEEDPNACVIC